MSAMTVEHSQVDYVHTQRQTLFDQLKEITGVEDEAVLEQALQASRTEGGKYDLAQAVNILVDENAVRNNEKRQKQPDVEKDFSAEQVKAKESGTVIDLTNEGTEKDALQRAIALSLEDQQHGMLGGQVSAEEQDISKVLEQSLLELKAGTKRKREEVWQDPLNPHERKRVHDWPVGLKNVGNTCWFSAVIQSLFHLPGRRNLLFMQELRRLFALMVGSRRKYVDPSKAVDILKEAFPCGSSDSQQDVSEFTHKLLEWLEDAFRADGYEKPNDKDGDEGSSEKEPANPMVDLFYGRFRSEGQTEGRLFSNEETFGQYPLQVNGFSNIHESLEAATAQEIESGKPGQEAACKSGQEHWFTKLPPVLLFELSRFQFNQHLGRPEKIHNKFDFPEVIYMDRYVEVNKNITKTKREEIRKMKQTREELQSKLDKYTNYGSGSKRFPLQEILQYTLEFVESKHESNPPMSDDVDMTSPCSSMSLNDSPSKSGGNHVTESPAPSTSAEQTSRSIPMPKHVTETELKVLQNCLTRWRTEVEHDIRGLQDNINVMDQAINSMYNDNSLKKVPYRLHAVLVHEGQAASGHYWAYVYNHRIKRWMKFNDITVTETTWEELQKESIGGYHNASAYCLMYIDSNKHDLVEDGVDKETGAVSLPADVRQLVYEDNGFFQKEIEEWDKQWVKMKEDAKNTSENTTESTDGVYNSEYSDLIASASVQALKDPAVMCSSTDPEIRLNKALDQEQKRLEKAAHDTLSNVCDYRLEHVLVYILVLQPRLPQVCIRVNLLEQFASLRVQENRGYFDVLQKLACGRLKILKETTDFQSCKKLYEQLVEDYNKFRNLAMYFILGFERFQTSRYDLSLPYWVKAAYLNEQLKKRYKHSLCCVNYKAVIFFRRQCLLKLNKEALLQFDSEESAAAPDRLELMTNSVVPCMSLLSTPESCEEDSAAAEEIRASWCSKLGEDISSPKREQLEELLVKLLDPSDYEIKLKSPPTFSQRFTDSKLSERFLNVMNQIFELYSSEQNR